MESGGEWVISKVIVHPPLVSEAVFVAAQQMRVARPTKDGGARRYLLAGLLECRLCGRRMDPHWVHGRAGYRCRHGYSSARARSSVQLKSVYVREDILLNQLVELWAEPGGHDIGGQGEDDVGGRAAEIASSLRSAATMIVHDGIAWELAANG